jgi:hypothetical protein
MDLSGYSGPHIFALTACRKGVEPPAVDETKLSVRLPFWKARTGLGTYVKVRSLDTYQSESALKLLSEHSRL